MDDNARVAERFWQGVDQSGGPDACWPWARGRDDNGYGRRFGGGLPRLAHRAAWLLSHRGEALPTVVRHACDNPPCCNPRHLVGGTHRENAGDREARGRGRQPRGETHGRAVLTEDLVRAILRARAEGLTYDAVAERVGVRKHNVAQVVTGKVWGHVTPDPL